MPTPKQYWRIIAPKHIDLDDPRLIFHFEIFDKHVYNTDNREAASYYKLLGYSVTKSSF